MGGLTLPKSRSSVFVTTCTASRSDFSSSSYLVLIRELLDIFIELTLRSADLLLEQFGTFLQVATDVTHWSWPPPAIEPWREWRPDTEVEGEARGFWQLFL